jgi:hypothetical protein
MSVPKAASLLLVFVLAKATILTGHHASLSWWVPIAYLWQDAAVVLIFAAIELCLGPRQRPAWIVYATLVLYAVINVPVERALSTPLTMSMWRAAGGPIADSMWYYVTWQNALLVVSVLSAAVMAPLVFRRSTHGPLVAALVLCVALGPAASARVDARGLDRNAWAALITSALPRMPSRTSTGDWRATGFDRAQYDDLSRFGGAAAGSNIVLVSLESTAAQYLGLKGPIPT